MTHLFDKLNLTTRGAMVVLNAPSSFDRELESLESIRVARSVDSDTPVEFAIAFAVT